MLKQIRQEKYRGMTYRKFLILHDSGKLTPHYYGYYVYLYKKFVPDITFSTFCYRARKRGLDKAIKVGYLGYGGDQNRANKYKQN